MVACAVLGSYEILGMLGEGAFGEVYRGVHRILGRPAAVKVLKSRHSLQEMERAIELFIREARVLALLNHPHIVTIFDVFATDNSLCIAMEYVEGEDLRVTWDTFSHSFTGIARHFGQTLLGLAAVHKQGIIHRDLKPENLIVEFDTDSIKIVDFGISCSLRHKELMTIVGGSSGTLPYMSPEQLRGDELDCRTDLWSVGVILYELLEGRHPFDISNPATLIRSISECDFKPIERAKDHAWAKKLIDGLLVADRNRRISSANEVLSILPYQVGDKTTRNKASDLNPEVLLQALLRVLPDSGITVERDIVFRWAAKDVGVKRIGKNIRGEFQKAVNRGIRRKLLVGDRQRISRV